MTPPALKNFLARRISRPLVMGVLNVTPDSFSDGGRFDSVEAAVLQANQLIADGADLLDVGGESTRPGSEPVDVDEQIRRTQPVIEAIRATHDIAISIDTTRSEVAAAAVKAGACMLNDIAAGRDDDDMLRLAADRDLPIVLMHMLGQPKSMQAQPRYENVTTDVLDFLRQRMRIAEGYGAGHLLIDPGIGFGKTTAHNLQLLRDLRLFTSAAAVLIGTSRKRFLGEITGETNASRRDDATTATTVWSMLHGAAIVRVHNARAARHAIDVTAAIIESD